MLEAEGNHFPHNRPANQRIHCWWKIIIGEIDHLQKQERGLKWNLMVDGLHVDHLLRGEFTPDQQDYWER